MAKYKVSFEFILPNTRIDLGQLSAWVTQLISSQYAYTINEFKLTKLEEVEE